MESIVNFFNVFYSSPIIYYSAPFTMFFILVFLSFVGLHLDFDIDPSSMSEGLQGFLSHFNLTKIPLFLYLSIYSFIGAAILVILHEFLYGFLDEDSFSPSIILNIAAIINIYLAAKLASIVLTPFVPLFCQDVGKEVDYLGQEAIVSSFELNNKGGLIVCDYDGSEHQLNACVDGDVVLNKGDKVLILLKNVEGERISYQVEKLNNF